jgi:hypothetical protein
MRRRRCRPRWPAAPQTSPTYWLNPKTAVSYPVSIQTPPCNLGTMSGLKNTPETTSSGAGTQPLGGLLFAICATLFLVPTMFSVVHARDRMTAEPASH